MLTTSIRSDNGPEFVAQEVTRWLDRAMVKTLFIAKGSLPKASLRPVWSKYSAVSETPAAVCNGNTAPVRISVAACLNLAESGGSIGTEFGDVWRTKFARRRRPHDGFCIASVAILVDWSSRVDQPQSTRGDRISADGESDSEVGRRQETDSAQRRSATPISRQREDAGAPAAA